MVSNNHGTDSGDNKEQIEEEVAEDNSSQEQNDDYKSRNWNKMLLGAVFIFFAVVIWYVIDLVVQ